MFRPYTSKEHSYESGRLQRPDGHRVPDRPDAKNEHPNDWHVTEMTEVRPARCANACRVLNRCLADCIDLHSQFRQARWHICGVDAAKLTKLLATINDAAVDMIERLGQRITALGCIAEGTLAAAAQRSGLDEYPLELGHDVQHVDAVVSALAVFSATIDDAWLVLVGFGDSISQVLLADILCIVDCYRIAVKKHQQTNTRA
jgi:starvation-inducible DNA-binding protein